MDSATKIEIDTLRKSFYSNVSRLAKERTNNSKSPKKIKEDLLNDWKFINPSNYEDKLPQPYRLKID